MTDAGITLGQLLRQERERRGITIEQVASATRISVRSLLALEGDQYGDLPAKPFVRGFVTSYARFIHLDPQEILTRFDDFISRKVSERPTRDSGHSGYAFDRKEGENSRTVLWVVIGVFVVFGGLAFLIFKPSFKHGRKSHIEKLKEASAQPSDVPSPVPLSKEVAALIATSTGTSLSTAAVALPSSGPSAAPSAAAPSPTPPLPKLPTFKAPSVPLVLARLARPEATPKPVKVDPKSDEEEDQPAAKPSAAPSPKPSLKPVALPSAKPSHKPVVLPAPAPSDGPTPAPSPSAKPDTLNSGADIPREAVKQKVVIKAIADVRVRYKVDDKSVSKLILRTGRILVLRARKVVRFQVSDVGGVNISLNGAPSGGFKEQVGYAERRDIGTLVFPSESSQNEADAFALEGALENPGPPPQRPASLQTP